MFSANRIGRQLFRYRMHIRSIIMAAALGLSAGLACESGLPASPSPSGSGGVSSSGSSDDGGSGGAGSGSGSNGAASSGGTVNCSTPQTSALHARLLSPSQYDNTVQDLLQIGGNPSKTYYVTGGETAQLDQVAVGHRADAAAAIAAQASATLSAWSPCVPPTVPAATCEQQIIDQVGMRAYRHPLSGAERAQLQALFDAGVKAKDFATGVDWFLTGLLQTPDFQYQLVRPATTEQVGQVLPITGYEMASRLSYFVWNTMPDTTLFAAAAASDGLGTPRSIQDQVNRMVQDPSRLTRGVSAFYSNWLTLDSFAEVQRSDPAFTVDVALSLGQSLLLGATQLYAMPSPNISALFTGQTYYMNKTLQAYYGLSGAGTAAYTATDMPGQHRSGLLTHPALLALNARPQKTAPINRGMFVLTKLMCIPLQLPVGFTPPPTPDAPTPGMTTRQELEVTHVQTACAGCHNMIDPPGFALEGFDQFGRVRTTDNGQPVDTSGKIINSGAGTSVNSNDLDGVFADGNEFISRIATSSIVKACFAQQYLEHAISGDVGTVVAPEQQCSVNSVSTSFAKSGDLKGLVGLVAATDSFRLRRSEGAPR